MVETSKETDEDLLEYYKFKYNCKKCGTLYGSDKTDNSLLCPNCDSKGKNFKKK